MKQPLTRLGPGLPASACIGLLLLVMMLIGSTHSVGADKGRKAAARNVGPGVPASRSDQVYRHLAIPDSVDFKIGKPVRVLKQARDLKEIVGWTAEHDLTRGAFMQTLRPPYSWFAVVYDVGSGAVLPVVHLYGYVPAGLHDPRPWKLMLIGRVNVTDSLARSIEMVYIDREQRTLVLAARTGKVVNRIGIDNELKAMQRSHSRR